MAKTVIYLHGFKSSPNSHKANVLEEALAKKSDIRFLVPEQAKTPINVIQQFVTLIEMQKDPVYLIGSSLGAYFATYLSERFNIKAALVNPAIKPFNATHHIGHHVDGMTGEHFVITELQFNQLKTFNIQKIRHPENFLLLLQTGDETLDYRQALEKFPHSKQIVQNGGNHRFENFDKVLGDIFNFFEI